MINTSRQGKASQGGQHRLMLIARHEQMLATFVFSLANNRMDLSMHCRASNVRKSVEVWGCFLLPEVRSGVKVKHKDWMINCLGMSLWNSVVLGIWVLFGVFLWRSKEWWLKLFCLNIRDKWGKKVNIELGEKKLIVFIEKMRSEAIKGWLGFNDFMML